MPQRKHKHFKLLTIKLQKRKPKPFDYVIYFFTVATPLFEIPQAIVIYKNHSAQDVSIWSWSFFILDNIVWIVYGVRNKSKPLLITSVMYLITEIIVVAGIVKYS